LVVQNRRRVPHRLKIPGDTGILYSTAITDKAFNTPAFYSRRVLACA
jgi:hypothetical protein